MAGGYITAVPQTGSDEMRFFRGLIHIAKSRQRLRDSKTRIIHLEDCIRVLYNGIYVNASV